MAQMGMQLSEQNDLLRTQQETINRLHADLHRRDVDDRVAGWAGKGLDRLPGFLKSAREIMLADDGGPALVLNLAEDQGGRQELTASGLVERLVASLPFDETSGKLQLGQQAFAPDVAAVDGTRPPQSMQLGDGQAVGGGFDNSPEAVEARSKEAREELGIVAGVPGGGDS
jgi:hypothetical protein